MLSAGLVIVVKLVIIRNKNPENEEFSQQWATFFEELKDRPNCRIFYILYFMRRLAIDCVILFIDSDLVQLIVSVAVTLVIPTYVLATKPFLDNKTNVYMVVNEFVLIAYYMTLLVGILSIGGLDIGTIGNAAIKIGLVALGVNVLYSMTCMVYSVHDKYCKKKIRVHPNTESNITQVEKTANLTTWIEPDTILHKNTIEMKNVDNFKRKK